MQGAEKVRVGIITADPLRALGLQSILHEGAAIEPVLCALETVLTDGSLTALLLDDRFEGHDALATLTRLRRERPDLKLIVVGEALDSEYIEAVMRAGAQGYLLETTGEAEVRMAMDAVLGGSLWAPPKVLARMMETGGVAGANGGEAPSNPVGTLTVRERQVLELLIDGKSNREIGQALGIDEVTVKAHLGRMLRKTHSKNRVELTLRALEARSTSKKDPDAGV